MRSSRLLDKLGRIDPPVPGVGISRPYLIPQRRFDPSQFEMQMTFVASVRTADGSDLLSSLYRTGTFRDRLQVAVQASQLGPVARTVFDDDYVSPARPRVKRVYNHAVGC